MPLSMAPAHLAPPARFTPFTGWKVRKGRNLWRFCYQMTVT